MFDHRIGFGRKSDGLFFTAQILLDFLILVDDGKSERLQIKPPKKVESGLTVDAGTGRDKKMLPQFHHDILAIRHVTPCVFAEGIFQVVPPSDKHLLVDPHECARVVGFAFVLYAVEAVSPLAVVPLVVVVVLHLPHRFKHSRLCELKEKHMSGWVRTETNSILEWPDLMKSRGNIQSGQMGIHKTHRDSRYIIMCKTRWRWNEEGAHWLDRWIQAHTNMQTHAITSQGPQDVNWTDGWDPHKQSCQTRLNYICRNFLFVFEFVISVHWEDGKKSWNVSI